MRIDHVVDATRLAREVVARDFDRDVRIAFEYVHMLIFARSQMTKRIALGSRAT
jgi:hypothetical protein